MGALLLVASTSLHGLGMYVVHDRFDRHWPEFRRQRLRRQVFFSGLVLLILTTHLAEMLLWGCTLVVVGAIPIFRDAYYYAAVTYKRGYERSDCVRCVPGWAQSPFHGETGKGDITKSDRRR